MSHRNWHRAVWLLALLVIWSVPALAANRPIAVNFHFEGSEPGNLKSLIESVSQLEQSKGEGAPSRGSVRRVASGDLKRFRTVLDSEGFYAGTANVKVDRTDKGYSAAFDIKPGPRFRITGYTIQYTNPGPDTRPKSPGEVGIETTGSSRGSDIASVLSQLITYLRRVGYPQAAAKERRALADMAKGEAKMVLVVDSGPFTRFGPVQWPDGLRTKTDFLDKYVPWKTGELYNVQRASDFRSALMATGLFASATVQPGTPGADGIAPVEVSLVERKPNSVAAGVSYSTNVGVGGTGSWTRRDLLGRGEQLQITFNLAQDLQQGQIGFIKPKLFDQTDLTLALTAKNENSDAYVGQTYSTTGDLARKFSRYITGHLGTELSYSHYTDGFGTHNAYLLGFPVSASWSNVDNILDPTTGLRVTLGVRPYIGATDARFISFTQFEGNADYHVPIDAKDNFVLAFWSHAGASIGPGVSSIPAEKRFYAGGGGSVRAYGYRLIGPLDANGDPTGGRSVLEGGTELRFPIWKKVGGAVFFEGGGVSQAGIFTFDTGIRYGAGFGIRYYTSIGPIRADIAFPVNPRPVDKAVQFYISLGQPF